MEARERRHLAVQEHLGRILLTRVRGRVSSASPTMQARARAHLVAEAYSHQSLRARLSVLPLLPVSYRMLLYRNMMFTVTANPNTAPFDNVPPVTTGSSNPPYNPFTEKDPATNSNITLQYQSISCMPAYRGCSLEEIRWQDYQQGRKTAGAFGQSTFGAPAAQPTTGTGLFGQPAAPTTAQPTNTSFGSFGNSNTAATTAGTGAFGTFGQPAASTTTPATGGGLFGGGGFGQQPQPQPQQQTGGFGAFGQPQQQPAAGGLFGGGGSGGAFGAQNQQPKPFGAFGATGNTGTTGTTGGFGAFGQPNQPQPAATGTGLFGQPQQPQQQQPQQPNNGFGAFGKHRLGRSSDAMQLTHSRQAQTINKNHPSLVNHSSRVRTPSARLVAPTRSLTNSRERNRLAASSVAPIQPGVASSAILNRTSNLVSSSQQQVDVGVILVNMVYLLTTCRSVQWQPTCAAYSWWLIREPQ